ncbi:hypothetical protein [Arthrobacter woluwensis]|uniref:hypothetical protein n=1 Tax=Arthrobacter woluwensis TaxID=156980 RepID=UPI0011A06DBC|nr:hypothetical protein [Arthrobacter woluwensis]
MYQYRATKPPATPAHDGMDPRVRLTQAAQTIHRLKRAHAAENAQHDAEVRAPRRHLRLALERESLAEQATQQATARATAAEARIQELTRKPLIPIDFTDCIYGGPQGLEIASREAWEHEQRRKASTTQEGGPGGSP